MNRNAIPFYAPVVTLDDAKALFRALHAAGLGYHPEDSAADIVDAVTGPYFSPAESAALDARMAEAFALDWQQWEDPCGYFLALDSGIPAEHATVGTRVVIAPDAAEGDTGVYEIVTPHEGKGRVDISPVSWDGPVRPSEVITLANLWPL